MRWLRVLFARQIVAAVLLKKTGKQWHWVQVAHNGETLSTSETYSSKDKCVETAQPVADQLGVPLR